MQQTAYPYRTRKIPRRRRRLAAVLFRGVVTAAILAVVAIVALLSSGRDLNSSHAILMERDGDHDVLLDQASGERMYPASLTKMMTAVVVLESTADYGEPVTLEQHIFDEAITQDLAVAGFFPGESVSVRDLLYGMLLPSGAECAMGLAEHTAGSEEAFAGLMNQKAEELGMNDTHFTNSTGLHDPEQYSTVRDMAILLDYALENEMFYEIFTSRRHSVMSTNKHPDGVTFESSMFSKAEEEYGEFTLLGGKTGYTPEAGQCLASLAEKNGELYILVTAGAPVKSNLYEAEHVDDAVKVFSGI
jgi:D-alanyl-D-alanine carboxypeptidase (penicillin-binding protein 5/6)